MDLSKYKIGFGITGSFCTITSVLEEMIRLKNTGADIYPVLSFNVSKLDNRFNLSHELKEQIKYICNKKIIDTIQDAEPFGPQKKMDAFIIAPCTGNTISKLSNGVTDTPVTMAAKATLRNNKPVIIAVSTNDGLSGSAKNIGSLLNYKNYYFVPFGQDDCIKKETSLVAKMELIIPTLEAALSNKQIQPLLV